MADATLLPTVRPKELGKQLRAVRRRKGLSLSEVARGAGLSRRELVSYERGKVEIPESDLWVIAGSCGVDVAELVPPTDPMSLPAAPETIQDSISQLRRNNHGDGGLQRHLDTLYALRALPPGSVVQLQERERQAMANALGGDPASIEARLVETMRISHDEARRLRALVVPDTAQYSPLALDAPPPEPTPDAWFNGAAAFATEATPADQAPVPAPDLPSGPVDVFEELAKLPEPIALPDQHAAGHEMFAAPPEPVSVHAAADAGAAGAFATWSSVRSALPEPCPPVVVEASAPAAAPESPAFGAAHAPPIDVVGRSDVAGLPDGPDVVEVIEPGGWEPPTPTTGSWDSWVTPQETRQDTPPEHMVEFVDELVDQYVPGEVADPPTDAQKAADESAWNSWASTAFVDDAPGLAGRFADVPFVEGPLAPVMDESLVATPDPGLSATPWGHQPDPEASSTGFYVDWGGSDAPVEEPGPPCSPLVDDDHWVPPDDPEPISWRPLADTVLAAVAAEMAATAALDAEPEPVEEFVVAGAEWALGNALPLVEVRGQGGLVMRRADERWALADVVASPSFALEVDVDFRSGPGFGVLFSASTDADGHMSGYSFDVDPIHEGGSYLVRQWHADRELWNPIAHVPAPDPADMHGVLTLRVVVDDEAVTASVNNDVVLTVESLKQACADRNREPAVGDRVGIQAWSSSDLVIDALRVAER